MRSSSEVVWEPLMSTVWPFVAVGRESLVGGVLSIE